MRGMGKYVYEFITHTSPLENIEWRFFGDRPATVFHKPSVARGYVDLFNIRGYRFHTWEQIGIPWKAQKAGLDILHCTGTTLPYWQSIPTITTIHDTLIWQESNAHSFEQWYIHKLIPRALEKCAAIITISESSRQDILNLWPNFENKLFVIPHGINDIYFNLEAQELPPLIGHTIGKAPYLLYIGGSLERKRFKWAVSVLAHLGNPEIKLVACGFSEAEKEKAFGALGSELRHRVVFLPFVEELHMVQLYQQAVAVLYPTLYEGFGFPALEAQAAGTPVLFSPLGSLKELEGPAAKMLPPYDLEAWVYTCRQLINQRAKSLILCNKARQWAQQFSWKSSAVRHIELYKKVVQCNIIKQ